MKIDEKELSKVLDAHFAKVHDMYVAELNSVKKNFVRDVFTELLRMNGIDATNPIENQKDFAKLRELRETGEKVMLSVKTAVAAAVLAATTSGITAYLAFFSTKGS